MVTQPVCRPKKVLEQQSRLPTSRPPTSARTVSTGSPPFPEQPSAGLARARSTASAHGHDRLRLPVQDGPSLAGEARRAAALVAHQSCPRSAPGCFFVVVAATACLFMVQAKHLTGCSLAKAAAARKLVLQEHVALLHTRG